MTYQVQQPSVGASVGAGIGKSLAELVPKEVERYRLSKGLQQLGQQKGLSPTELYTQALSIPGIIDRPEVLRNLTDLIKRQSLTEAYGGGNQPQAPLSRGGGISPERENIVKDLIERTQRPETVSPEQQNVPRIVETNPLRPEAIPAKPWTNQRRNQEIAAISEKFPWFTHNEIMQEAAEREKRELAQPLAEQERDTYTEDVKKKVHDQFLKELGTKLQKHPNIETTGELFKDISGENLVDLQRGLDRDIRLNPNKSKDEIINDWTRKALDFAKAKTQLNTFANSSQLLASLSHPSAYKNKLKEFSKIYADAGMSEEYFNTLKNTFGFSPMYAAQYAFPLGKETKNYISKKPHQEFSLKGRVSGDEATRKNAEEVLEFIRPNDSILSIAGEMKKKFPNFDPFIFFEQLRNHSDQLTPRQQRELAEGAKRGFTWADIIIGD